MTNFYEKVLNSLRFESQIAFLLGHSMSSYLGHVVISTKTFQSFVSQLYQNSL